jgi:hypothetical protein
MKAREVLKLLEAKLNWGQLFKNDSDYFEEEFEDNGWPEVTAKEVFNTVKSFAKGDKLEIVYDTEGEVDELGFDPSKIKGKEWIFHAPEGSETSGYWCGDIVVTHDGLDLISIGNGSQSQTAFCVYYARAKDLKSYKEENK